MGTDGLGRDLLSRTLVGGQVSLIICVLASLGALMIGVLVGGISAMAPKWLDQAIMRGLEIILSLPYVIQISLVGLYINSIWDYSGLLNIWLSLVLTAWVPSARFIRNIILQEAQKPYIESVRALGAARSRILFIHIFPNIRGKIAIYWGLHIPQAMLAEGILSFIGLGAKSPLISWGQLLQEGWRTMAHYPHLLWGPALVFFVAILSFNWLLEGYRRQIEMQLPLRQLTSGAS